MSDQTSDETTGKETLPLPSKVAGQDVKKPDFITSEQLEKAVEVITNRFKDTMDSYNREIQSREGKFMAGVKKRVSTLENAARNAGVELSDAQRESLQERAFLEELDQLTTEPSDGRKPIREPSGDGSDENDRVNMVADSMMDAWGVVVYEDDPEAKIMTEAEEKSEKEYYEAVLKAIQTKAARIQAQPDSETEDTNKVAARLPGALRGSSAPPELWKMSKGDLWEKVKEEGKIK